MCTTDTRQATKLNKIIFEMLDTLHNKLMLGLSHTETMDRIGSVYCSPSLTSSAWVGDRGIVCRRQKRPRRGVMSEREEQEHKAIARTRCLCGYSTCVGSYSLNYPPGAFWFCCFVTRRTGRYRISTGGGLAELEATWVFS